MPTENAYLQFAERYYHDPGGFSENVLGITPDKCQRELLEDIAAKERLLTVRSGHGTGKSTALAIASCWFACTRYPFKIVMTAPTSSQLFDALYAETAAQFNRLPAELRGLFTVKADRIVLNASEKDCFISARTSTKEKPEALAGVHSDNVLLLVDEASGVPEEVFESAQGSMSTENATTILTGNPTRTSGMFFETHHTLADTWKCHHWSSIDSPRVSPDFIEQIRRTYGEGSNQWKVRVLGDFPDTDDETIMSRATVRKAMERDIEPDPNGTRRWGLDPARFGSDRTAWCERIGSVVTQLEHQTGLSTMEVAGWIKHKWDETPWHERPVEILIDVIGIGAGVVDRLEELGLPVTGVNVSDASLVTSDGEKLRDQLWLDLKKWVEGYGKLPDSRELMEDLVRPLYKFNSRGKIKVESKDEMKRRGKKSPDLADVIALTFASEPATLASGSRPSQRKPIRRNLRAYG